MLRDILFGTLAGAAGTVVLNITTYADMVIRSRPASQTPAKVAEKIAAGVGVDLAGQAGASAQGPAPSDQDQQTAQQRASGLGALLGYAAGLGVGTAYGVVRLAVREVPVPLAGIVLGRRPWPTAISRRSSSALPTQPSGAPHAGWPTSSRTWRMG